MTHARNSPNILFKVKQVKISCVTKVTLSNIKTFAMQLLMKRSLNEFITRYCEKAYFDNLLINNIDPKQTLIQKCNHIHRMYQISQIYSKYISSMIWWNIFHWTDKRYPPNSKCDLKYLEVGGSIGWGLSARPRYRHPCCEGCWTHRNFSRSP